MSALAQLQERFQGYVLAGDEAMVSAVVGTAKADASLRLDIYSQAYRLRLLEVLGNDFSGLKVLIGEDAFDELGRAYIETHPSPHFNAPCGSGRNTGHASGAIAATLSTSATR